MERYAAFYRAAFDLQSRHKLPSARPSEEFWYDLWRDCHETSARFGDDPFLVDLLVSVAVEIEREYKEIANAMEAI